MAQHSNVYDNAIFHLVIALEQRPEAQQDESETDKIRSAHHKSKVAPFLIGLQFVTFGIDSTKNISYSSDIFFCNSAKSEEQRKRYEIHLTQFHLRKRGPQSEQERKCYKIVREYGISILCRDKTGRRMFGTNFVISRQQYPHFAYGMRTRPSL